MNFLSDVWNSFLDMPLWVRVWVFIILIPINFASILFIGNPYSILISFLAIIGILLNLIPMWVYRGFTEAMAISHVIFWIPLVAILFFQLFIFETALNDRYYYFILLLFIINVISLVFDIPDSIKWFKNRVKTS